MCGVWIDPLLAVRDWWYQVVLTAIHYYMPERFLVRSVLCMPSFLYTVHTEMKAPSDVLVGI